METLLQLLLESKFNKEVADEWVRSGKQMSIQYKDPETSDKFRWYRISPVKVVNTNGKDYLIAWDKGSGKEEQRYFDLGGISNVNRSTTSSSSWTEDDIVDSIRNKRVVEITYQGLREKSKGQRFKVMPVCLGTKRGRKYIRAWQESGASVRGVPNWKFFRIDRISDWKNQGNLNFQCSDLGPNLNQSGDKGMDRILAIVDCDAVAAPAPQPTAGKPKEPSTKKKSTTKKPSPKTKTSTPSPEPDTSIGGTSPGSVEPQAKTKKGAARPGAKSPERGGKGAARPGAKNPERSSKGAARPGALNEAVMNAIDIL